MYHFTFWTATATILIAALLLFWAVAPTSWTAKFLNVVGNGVQWVVAKVRGLFKK